mgnify:FL=1
MTSLAIVSSVSDLLQYYLVREHRRTNGELSIIATTQQSYQQIKQVGLSPILIQPNPKFSWAEHDQLFSKIAMWETEALDFELPGLHLPIWKVLSLDRLSFWFGGAYSERFRRLIDLMKRDRLIVSLDMKSPHVWGYRDVSYTAVQTQPIRTRDVLDFAPHLPFSQIVLRSQRDADFLKEQGYKGELDVITIDDTRPIPPREDEFLSMRQGLNIDPAEKVLLVFYEGQIEWAFRRWVQKRIEKPRGEIILILPASKRDESILMATAGRMLQHVRYQIVTNWDVEVAANEIIMFQYRDDIIPFRRVPVHVMDVGDRFRSSSLVPKEVVHG